MTLPDKIEYINRSGGTGWRPSVQLLMSLGDSGGFCVNCGGNTDGIEKDGLWYPCPHCGKNKVYGWEALILMKFAY